MDSFLTLFSLRLVTSTLWLVTSTRWLVTSTRWLGLGQALQLCLAAQVVVEDVNGKGEDYRGVLLRGDGVQCLEG